MNVASYFICHRCPHFDRDRGKNGLCTMPHGHSIALKKNECNLLTLKEKMELEYAIVFRRKKVETK